MLHRGFHVVLEEIIDLVRPLILLLLLAHGSHTNLISRTIKKLSVVVRVCSVIDLLASALRLSIGLSSAGPDKANLV